MPRGLLQRDGELAAIERQLGEVCDGTGRVCVVEGPAGIGKSSLLRAAAHAAEASGMRVLRAWASPLEQQAGWGIARQLFAPIADGPEWDEVAHGAATLARLVYDPVPGQSASAGDARHAAAYGLTWLACGLAERSPTVLVVDDVHWADAASLRWLVQLSRQLAELPLGLLCAVRAGEPPAHPEEFAELVAAAPEPPVRPGPLGPEAVGAIMADRLPTAGTEFARSCHAVSAGNPFLLGALVDQLVAEGVEPTAELAARLTAFGPEQVTRSVEVQLSRLPSGAVPLARATSVMGRGAPLRQVGALAGIGAVDAQRLADRLMAIGLLTVDGHGYALTHPLVASAIYRGMPAGERALLHGRAAAMLAGERADPEAVGLHLLRSEPAGEPATVEALRAAAERAVLRGAPESAAEFLRRALAEPPASPDQEAGIRSELGLALAAQVRPGADELLYDAVELATDPGQRLRFALSGSRALGLAGHFEQAVELCRRALREHGGDPAARDQIEIEMACNMILQADTVDEARDRLQRRTLGEAATVPWRMLAAWEALSDLRPLSEVRGLLTPDVAEAAAGQTDSLLSAVAKMGLIQAGDLGTACAYCDALIEFARPRGWLIALAHGSFMRAIAYVRAGRIQEARADAQLSFDFKLGNSPPPALNWSLFPLVDALVELGELDAAEAALGAGGCLGELPAGPMSTLLLLESRARLRLAQHRPVEAHGDLVTAADWWGRFGIRSPAMAAWRVVDVEALLALGESGAAQALAREQVELAAVAGVPEPHGAGLRALARTVGNAEAVPLLEQAVAILDPSPARLEHTRALVELGAALRRSNQRAAAREPLRRALDLSERGGMRALEDRARRELLATGARPRRSAVTGVESLTPAERQVASLAAQGLGNREIAQQLYVTRRTVETHLTHVFTKLGLSGRSELGGIQAVPIEVP